MSEYDIYGIKGPEWQAGVRGTLARVVAVHRERFEIVTEYGFSHARMKRGKQYREGGELPTAGDFIDVEYNPSGDSMATAVLPRRTQFVRQDSWHGTEQLVAANFDCVFIVTSLNAEFNARRLERYLALALESGAQIAFLLTKLDLADEAMVARARRATEALALGHPVLALSARSGEGMQQLCAYLTRGKSAVLLGSSGVGKSSLVNALSGDEVMEVAAIREDDAKGRHTTAHRQIIALRNGALLIDTPGMRELGMWDALSGVADVFAEVAEAAARCHFADCTHTHEPGCAVLADLAAGRLDPKRVRNYLNMHSEADLTAARALKAKRNKEISKFARQLRKAGRT